MSDIIKYKNAVRQQPRDTWIKDDAVLPRGDGWEFCCNAYALHHLGYTPEELRDMDDSDTFNLSHALSAEFGWPKEVSNLLLLANDKARSYEEAVTLIFHTIYTLTITGYISF